MLLDVRGKAADVETAFHVRLLTYQHPTERREFFAPDVEPSVDSDLPILHVHGLETYTRLRSALHQGLMQRAAAISASGSQSNGYLLGSDFRNAYAPGVSLTGAGQMVGLLELDGFYPSDITAYEQLARYSAVPVIQVPENGYDTNSTPGSGDTEVSLDIEMSIAMAPGLSAVVVYEAPNDPGTDHSNGYH